MKISVNGNVTVTSETPAEAKVMLDFVAKQLYSSEDGPSRKKASWDKKYSKQCKYCEGRFKAMSSHVRAKHPETLNESLTVRHAELVA